jgi:N-acetylglucosamine repressor
MANNEIVKKSSVEIKKELLKKNIISHLYREGHKSVADISHSTHMSSPTIAQIITELTQEHWIKEYGQRESTGGRKPSIYGLSPSTYYVLIIDCGFRTSRIALFNLCKEKIAEETFEADIKEETKTLNTIFVTAQRLIEKHLLQQQSILACGVSFPGLVNSEKGINHSYFTTLGKPVRLIVQESLGIPTFIENDAKASTLGEFMFGKAQGLRNVLSLTIDWGVGMGMILDGQLFHGTSGFAGEIGHIPASSEHILCSCGKTGCLETIASSQALAQQAREALKNGMPSQLQVYLPDKLDQVDATKVIHAAIDGDSLSIELLTSLGAALGRSLSIAIQLTNPEIIILGGEVAEAGQFLVNPIMQMLHKYNMVKIKNDVKFAISELGQDARLLGVYAFVMDNLLDSKNKYLKL